MGEGYGRLMGDRIRTDHLVGGRYGKQCYWEWLPGAVYRLIANLWMTGPMRAEGEAGTVMSEWPGAASNCSIPKPNQCIYPYSHILHAMSDLRCSTATKGICCLLLR
ncbi:hypothetical protein ACUHMQ_03145 [Chitinimonas sp. PSY-7]|uniref:hypothetical protein n=1 Tax=Chitinimonas sp. PSY-7 TaxID=3459088 RepID=UPI00403FFE59